MKLHVFCNLLECSSMNKEQIIFLCHIFFCTLFANYSCVASNFLPMSADDLADVDMGAPSVKKVCLGEGVQSCEKKECVPPLLSYTMAFVDMNGCTVSLAALPDEHGMVRLTMKDVCPPVLEDSTVREIVYGTSLQPLLTIILTKSGPEDVWGVFYTHLPAIGVEARSHYHNFVFDARAGSLWYCAPCCVSEKRLVFENVQRMPGSGLEMNFLRDKTICSVKMLVSLRSATIVAEVPNPDGELEKQVLDFIAPDVPHIDLAGGWLPVESFFIKELPKINGCRPPRLVCSNDEGVMRITFSYECEENARGLQVTYDNTNQMMSVQYLFESASVSSIFVPILQCEDSDSDNGFQVAELFDDKQQKNTMFFSKDGVITLRSSDGYKVRYATDLKLVEKSKAFLKLDPVNGGKVGFYGLGTLLMMMEFDSRLRCMIAKFCSNDFQKVFPVFAVPVSKKFLNHSVRYVLNQKSPAPCLDLLVYDEGQVYMDFAQKEFFCKVSFWKLRVRAIPSPNMADVLFAFQFSISDFQDQKNGTVQVGYDVSENRVSVTTCIDGRAPFTKKTPKVDDLNLRFVPCYNFFEHNCFLSLKLNQKHSLVWSVLPRKGFWGLDRYNGCTRIPTMNAINLALSEAGALSLKGRLLSDCPFLLDGE